MITNPSVSLRFNQTDKAALAELAGLLNMKQAQTIRVLVHEKLSVMKSGKPKTTADKFNHASPVKDSAHQVQA